VANDPIETTRGNTAPAVDAERFKASIERLSEIYRDIALKAEEVTRTRCPYKDANSRCTALFGCRHQYFTKDPGARPVCTGSDKLDYRDAWEM
jgi:hypothetical protein